MNTEVNVHTVHRVKISQRIHSYYPPGVLLEVHLLVVEWVEVLVMVHQVVPELVVLRSLPAEQWFVHVLDPHT